MKNFIRILLLFTITLTPNVVQAQINAGIVTGIWFSEIPFFEGDNIFVHAIVRNQEDFVLEAQVDFKMGNKIIGSKTEIIPANNNIISSVDVVAEEGNHSFTVNISSAYQIKDGARVEVEIPSSNIISDTSVSVDKDTDGDNIGNSTDTDDDNDGVSDEEEKALGTNPLEKDSFENQQEASFSPNNTGSKETGISKIIESSKPITESIVSGIESATESVEDSAEPFVEQLIAKAEERKKNLFDVSVTSANRNNKTQGLLNKIQSWIFSISILYLKNWLMYTLTLVFLFSLWKFRRNRRYY